MSEQERWDSTIAAISKDVKGFKLVKKEDSKVQKVLGKLLGVLGMKYMNYWTTIAPKVYSGVGEQSPSRWKTMQHEWVHLKDIAKFKWPLFILVYYSPQVFVLLSLLAFVNLWWLLCLVFLLPLPSPGRMWLEMRGYRRSVELGRSSKSLVKQFTGKAYYFMWPFPKHVEKMLSKDSPYKDLMDKT